MGLLQSDKAVFYHPCDDDAEFVQASSWAEATTSFASGKVANAVGATGPWPSAASLGYESGLGVWGTENEFYSGGAAYYAMIRSLSSDKFLVLSAEGAVGGTGVMYVGTVAGGEITFGPSHYLAAPPARFWGGDIVALSDSKFAVCWQWWNDAPGTIRSGQCRVGEVAGTDITFGPQKQFVGGGGLGVPTTIAAPIDSTKFVVCYPDGEDSYKGAARIGQISGLDVTFSGAKQHFTTGGVGSIDCGILSSSSFVVCFKDNSDSDHGTSKVGIVSGSDITFGSDYEFATSGVSGSTGGCELTVLGPATFVVAYKDASDSSGYARVGAVAGTAISFGAATQFEASIGGVSTAIRMTGEEFVVAYTTGAGAGRCVAGQVSGSSISFGGAQQFAASSDLQPHMLANVGGDVLVGYRDDADSGHGTVRRAAFGPDVYATVFSETRVAFCGWFKAPSA